MAIDFYKLGKKTGAKTPKGQQSGFEALASGVTNTVDNMIAASQIKTAALQAAMPQGVAIEKVPEELRTKATEFLTANKKAYTDASKVLASGINSSSARYRKAIETINGVNTKFENLSTSLEAVALKRQAALDDPNGYSPSTGKEDRLTWGNLSNGDLYSSMTFNDDGTVNYTNSQGESKSFADFNVSPQSFEGQNTFLALNDKFTNAKYSGKSDQWSMHSGEAETTVNALFQKLKPAGQKDMMMGDIDYLEKTTGFESGTDEYENAINGILENPNDAIAGYKQHIVGTLETNYNNQKGPKTSTKGGGANAKDGKFGGWGSYNVKTGGNSEYGPVSISWADAAKRRNALDDLETVNGSHGVYTWDGEKYTDEEKNTYSIKELVRQEGLYKPNERLSSFDDDVFLQNKDDKENSSKGFATMSMLKTDGDDATSGKLNDNFGLGDNSKYKFVPFTRAFGKGAIGYYDGVDDNILTNDVMLIDPKTNYAKKDKNGDVYRFGTGDNANADDLKIINELLKDSVKKQTPVNEEFAK